MEWTLLWLDGAEEFVYGNKKEIKNELLFSECTKKDYRIRVNLVEGEYSQDIIKGLVFLNNLLVGKI